MCTKIKSRKMIFDFLLGGNAIFTLENSSTGNRFTFKVTQSPRDHGLFWVKVLTGPDNQKDYTYFATYYHNWILSETNQGKNPADAWRIKYNPTKGISPKAQSARTFTWFIQTIHKGDLPENIIFRHEGKCGRCGRKLTVPESLDSGFGPECINLIHKKQYSHPINL